MLSFRLYSWRVRYDAAKVNVGRYDVSCAEGSEQGEVQRSARFRMLQGDDTPRVAPVEI